MIAKLLLLVAPLGLDTFLVAAALGAAGLPRQRRRRVSLLMAGFEALMPLIGLAAGAPLGRAIGATADYAAAALLVAFGAFVALKPGADDDAAVARLGEVSGWAAVLLGLSVSLDELAIGFVIGLLRLPILPVVVLIGVQALIVSQLGLALGGRLSETRRERAERLAGGVLAGLGLFLIASRAL